MKTVVQPEHAEAPARNVAVISLFSDWVQQGTENFFAAQRVLLELVMRQNGMAMDALRGRLTTVTPASTIATEAAGEGFANFIAAQKIFLELAKKQNEIVMTRVKERVGAVASAAVMADLLRRSVETFIDLQEQFLDVAAKQSKVWFHSAKTGKPFTGAGLGELAQEGVGNIALAQKKFLDVIAEETAKASKEIKATAKPAEKPELGELARHSLDAFIEAQKELLDMAGRQMELNLKAAGKAADVFTAAPGITLGELSLQGVESFVAAQKALIEVLVKSGPATAKGGTKEHAHPAAHRAHAH